MDPGFWQSTHMPNTNIANLIEQTLAELAIEDLCRELAEREPSEANQLVWALVHEIA